MEILTPPGGKCKGVQLTNFTLLSTPSAPWDLNKYFYDVIRDRSNLFAIGLLILEVSKRQFMK